MKKIVNYGLLIGFNMCLLFFVDITGPAIISLCLALTCIGLEYILENKYLSMTLLLLYALATTILPVLSFFIPIVVAGIVRSLLITKSNLFLVFYMISFLLLAISSSLKNPIAIFFILFGCLISLITVYDNHKFEKLEYELIRTIDDGREVAYLLTERNKVILEKQDYEIYAATLRERNRIAREIHDNVGHLLSRSILINGALKTLNKQKELSPSLDSMNETLNNAMSTIRDSVHDLHDESVNLEEAINSIINGFEFCPIDFKYACTLNIPSKIKYSFISITKEALSNVIKHSDADLVDIIIREHPAIYQLIIKDNGKTINLNDNASGIGLTNIRDRVALLKGNLNIFRDDGFKIFITIPKEKAYEE
ncbi:MAG: sensor histidine kinase [Clostridiales bacterium]|nr:sensor histidine kinase [Clostridiales bacterium]